MVFVWWEKQKYNLIILWKKKLFISHIRVMAVEHEGIVPFSSN